MSPIRRYRYADILADLEGIDDWLARMGLPRRNDRIRFAIDVLRRAEAGLRATQENQQPEVIGDQENYSFGICEALEIRDIYLAFKDEPPEQIAGILGRALSGPHHPRNENDRNHDGRNIGFELAFGADLKLRGLAVELAEPDLNLVIENQRYLIACKRPRRRESIPTAIRMAARQLRENLRRAAPGTHGVIAISVSWILNPGIYFFVEHLERLGDRGQELLEANMEECRTSNRRGDVSATLFHVSTPSDQQGLLTRMTHFNVYDNGVPSAAFDLLGEHLTRAYPP